MAGEVSLENWVNELKAPFSIDINRFSSVTKLWRVTVLAQRFVSKLRKQSHIAGPLSASEIIRAENLWIAYLQKDQYGDIIELIQQSKSNNLKIQQGIFMDINGIHRCRGR